MNLHNEARGVRNNNPGNIRHGEEWLGLANEQTDSSFCQFVSVEYGIRAIFKILYTYENKYNLTTIRDIISRWAPPNENDTANYIKSVCETFQKYANSSEVFSPKSTIRDDLIPYFIMSIIKHENGIQPFCYDFISNCKNFN